MCTRDAHGVHVPTLAYASGCQRPHRQEKTRWTRQENRRRAGDKARCCWECWPPCWWLPGSSFSCPG